MLTANNLKGNWATLLLPVNKGEGIDWELLAEETDHFIRSKVDGIYSNGTAGELHNQTEAEFDNIQQLLSERCRKAKVRFQIGASHPGPLVSLERIRRTVALRPDAFQVILPDWVVATEEEQVAFLSRMAEAADGIPLVLYHPPHAKQVLTPGQIGKLKKAVPRLVGLKVGHGDSQWYEAMRLHASGLSVFVPGHFLATGLREGLASGAYSNVACLSPAGAQQWWEQMQADLEGALEVEGRIHRFFDECILPFKKAGYSNPALDKFLAAVGGWLPLGTRLRWPYRWISEGEVAAVRLRAKNYLPEFVC